MLVKASSRQDIEALAEAIRGVEKEASCQLAAVIVDLGLMRLRYEEPQVAGAMEMLKNVRGRRGLIDFFTFLWVLEPDTLTEFKEDIIFHILSGKDTEDSDSVGGWSQREIDLLLSNYEFQTVSA